MKDLSWIPPGMVSLAQRFARRFPGDQPEYAVAQFALETGRGQDVPGRGDDLWRNDGNPWCIKAAKDNRFQAGKTEDGYARYSSLEQAFWDRLRILDMWRKHCIKNGILHTDVLFILDRWWAPNQDYDTKLERIIVSDGLYRVGNQTSW